MPYIQQGQRNKLDVNIRELNDRINSEGELNYVITQLLRGFEKRRGASYRVFNALIGVLESCKLEFFRRKVSVYEDLKIHENGDVYFI